jgi:predicted glycosyltransferase
MNPLSRTPLHARAVGPAAVTSAAGDPRPVERCRTLSRSIPLRVAFYSHDTLGLGHIRRNLLIAQSFAQSQLHTTTLMLAGAREVGMLPLGPGVDCVTLPSIQKSDEGEYRSRRLTLALQQVVNMRARILQGALETFRPDVLIVDTEPRGAFRELEPALSSLRAQGRTHFVLGLRDVRDDPVVARREWQAASSEAAIRDYYDEVWVYGDPAVFDVVREYGLSAEVSVKLRYTGYLDQRQRLRFVCPGDEGLRVLETLPPGRMMLCTLGGGQDGAPLARAFIDAPLPAGAFGVVLAGPQMPQPLFDDLRGLAARTARVRLLRFLPEPAPLVAHADRLVTMGGYNSTLEALSFGKPALIVPRVRPRQEQWVRADRLRTLGLLDVLHPDRLSPAALGEWLTRESVPPPTSAAVDFGGLPRVVEFMRQHVSVGAEATPA